VLLEAIENLERAFGPQGLPVALALERLGSVKLRQGRADDALVVLERAVTIIEGHEGRAEFDTSIVWSRLGSALSALGRHDEALSAHREAHERLAAAFGPRHPRLSLPAMNRAYALQRAGRFGEAVTWFETAIDLLPLRSSRRRQRAMLQFELARVLWDSEIDRRRAVVEAAAAQRAFTPDDPPWDGIDRARIDDWLAARATDG
jgi:tetratricopeptide (TPR) repeat protein